MKKKMKMKNRSYDIDRVKPRHEHKCNKCKRYVSVMVLKHALSNT